jgi:hypothetical protein
VEVVAYNPEHYQKNKEKYSAKSKAWREANVERAKENRRKSYLANKEANLQYSKEYNLKRKFNITSIEYNTMLEKQNNVCAICGNTCSKSLAVDHCHTTGRIRGLLCNNCNRGLGHFKDNPNYLQKAIEYLKE